MLTQLWNIYFRVLLVQNYYYTDIMITPQLNKNIKNYNLCSLLCVSLIPTSFGYYHRDNLQSRKTTIFKVLYRNDIHYDVLYICINYF